MIYLVAPYTSAAREWCGVKGIDTDSVVVVTKDEDAQGHRVGSGDKVIQLPGADPSLFFELTVHTAADRGTDIPSNPTLW